KTLKKIEWTCNEIKVFHKDDLESLADALGDDEEAEEFAMQFSMLSGDAYSLRRDIEIYDMYIKEYFDNFFVAVKGGDSGGGLTGYDAYDCDYYGLDSYESSLAEEESQKRLQRLTKAEIINIATRCFRVFMSFQSVYSRYQDLKTAIDIIRDKHNGFIQTIRQINELYEKANEEYFFGEATIKFNKMLYDLPDYVWVE
ncbi:MAG: hypothetical protein K2K66_06685, partial [Ruminococcus sp.]|nr:hypothetical protein [Ruminococcus sp.]